MAQFIRVKNFEKFQHYKKRKPPWFKIYRDLWEEPRFYSLSESERYQLITLMKLASQKDNLIDVYPEWLQRQIISERPIAIERFIHTGWCEIINVDANGIITVLSDDASNMLAIPCTAKPEDALLETETETQRQKTETEEKPPYPPSGECNPDALFVIWSEEHGTLPECRSLSSERRRKCVKRISTHRSDLAKFSEDFRMAIRKASATPFCCGDGNRAWKVSFDWIIGNDTNYLKILEGKYDGRAPTKAEINSRRKTEALQNYLGDMDAHSPGNLQVTGGRTVNDGED